MDLDVVIKEVTALLVRVGELEEEVAGATRQATERRRSLEAARGRAQTLEHAMARLQGAAVDAAGAEVRLRQAHAAVEGLKREVASLHAQWRRERHLHEAVREERDGMREECALLRAEAAEASAAARVAAENATAAAAQEAVAARAADEIRRASDEAHRSKLAAENAALRAALRSAEDDRNRLRSISRDSVEAENISDDVDRFWKRRMAAQRADYEAQIRDLQRQVASPKSASPSMPLVRRK